MSKSILDFGTNCEDSFRRVMSAPGVAAMAGSGSGDGGGPAAPAESTEQWVRRLLGEHEVKLQKQEEKTTMLQNVVKELAKKTDEIDGKGKVGAAPPGLGSEDGQSGELKAIRKQIEEMIAKPQVTTEAMDDVYKAMETLRENLEHSWMNPGLGAPVRDDREPFKHKGWDTRKLILDPFDGDRRNSEIGLSRLKRSSGVRLQDSSHSWRRPSTKMKSSRAERSLMQAWT